MTLIQKNIEEIKNFPKENFVLLNEILNRLNQNLKEKREIMYSDIINLIIRKGDTEEKFNQLLLWCNYKMRLGEITVKI
ncbi:MAG: hypothetical protein KAT66_03060 [Candidatus Lokiarchaeota archaeon]|nr:hypothetical protein [Candidatus Lokiarchaeota archaeon]